MAAFALLGAESGCHGGAETMPRLSMRAGAQAEYRPLENKGLGAGAAAGSPGALFVGRGSFLLQAVEPGEQFGNGHVELGRDVFVNVDLC